MSQDLAAAFAAYLGRLVTRNKSDLTVDKYRRDGAQMVATFVAAGRAMVGQVDRTAVDAWVDALDRRGLHPNTIRCRIAMAQGFFGDLHARGEIAINPTARYPRPQLVTVHRPFLDPARVAVLLASLPNDFRGHRLRLLLMLAYHGGIRTAGALNLNWGDIDTTLREGRVMSKGAKPRVFPINDDLARELDAFRKAWAPGRRGLPTAPVFLGRCGKRWRAKDLYPALGKLGLTKEAMRMLRRSAFTNLARIVPLPAVQAFAGHANLSTTGIYIQVPSAQVQQAAQALNATAVPTTPAAVPTAAHPTVSAAARAVSGPSRRRGSRRARRFRKAERLRVAA